MKKIKKFALVIVSAMLATALSIPVYAEDHITESLVENEIDGNMTSSIDNPITLMDIQPPNDAETTLPYTAQPYDLYAGSGSYTLYSFKTKTGKLNMHYTLEAQDPDHGERSMTLYVYKKVTKSVLWWTEVSWDLVESKTITINDTTSETIPPYMNKSIVGDVSFYNLSTTESYCLRIVNSTSPSASGYNNAISVTIKITD